MGGAVGLVARAELRRRWGSIVVLALVIAVVGGIVFASVAGARRTASSFDRFVERFRPADVTAFVGDPPVESVDALRRVPGVEALGVLRQLALVMRGDEAETILPTGAPIDGEWGVALDRARVVAGRRPDADSVTEIALPEPLARSAGHEVGDVVVMDAFSPAQVEALKAGGDAVEVPRPAGPTLRLRVVGITRTPGDLGLEGSQGGVLVLPRAVADRYGDAIGSYSGFVVRARIAGGPRRVADVVREVERRFGGEPAFQVIPGGVTVDGVQESVDVLTIGLLAFAAIAAAAGLVALVVSLSRMVDATADDRPTLRALGLRRRQQGWSAVAVVAPAAIGGALLAVALAVALSPLLPFGVAGRAEPDRGVHADWLVLGVGATALSVVVLGAMFVLADHRARTRAPVAHRGVTARTLDRLDATGAPPSVSIGARLALDPGRGARSLPVRPALAGAVLAVAGVVAVTSFATSLHHLLVTPSAYGSPWDVRVVLAQSTYEQDDRPCSGHRTALVDEPAFVDLTSVCTLSVRVDGAPVTAFGFASLRGHLGPTIVSGRAPRRADEVALGAKTLERSGSSIGDRLTLTAPDGPARYRIVGRAVMPWFDDAQPLADGLVLTGAGLDRLDDPTDFDGYAELVANWTPGDDVGAASARVVADGVDRLVAARVPVEVARVDQVKALPWILAGLLGVLGCVAIGFALLSAGRRRAHDLAILKTIGFVRADVRRTLAWQASTLAGVGLVLGVPIGSVAGAALWRAVAEAIGVSTRVSSSWGLLLLVVGATLLVANLVAWFPAAAAARTEPARVLRTE